MSTNPHRESHFTSSEVVRDIVLGMADGLTVPFALASARNIALAYVAGGIIPLLPYMLQKNAGSGLCGSMVVTLLALAGFGGIKGRYTGTSSWRSGLQTTVVGGLAAGAAFLLAKLIS
jgi:VIT1/CCC1 family predicted Fe2+/Mn2+ transporter